MESLYHHLDSTEKSRILTYHQIEHAPKFEYTVTSTDGEKCTSTDSLLLYTVGIGGSGVSNSTKMLINFHLKADRAINMLISLQRIALAKYQQQREASAAVRATRLGASTSRCLGFFFASQAQVITYFTIIMFNVLCGPVGVEKKTIGGRELDDEEHRSTYKQRRAAALARGEQEDDGSGRWLDTLLRKFHNECSHVIHREHDTSLLRSLIAEEDGASCMDNLRSVVEGGDAANGGNVPLSKLSKPRLDRFSAFLSCCAVGDVSLSRREVQAMIKVLTW